MRSQPHSQASRLQKLIRQHQQKQRRKKHVQKTSPENNLYFIFIYLKEKS